MKLSLILPMMLLAAPAYADQSNVHLGSDWSDDSFIMPFMLVKNESIELHVQVEHNVIGQAIACRLLSEDKLLDSDSGRECHLQASGMGLRHYVLQVINLDSHGHQIYIDANRGRTHQ